MDVVGIAADRRSSEVITLAKCDGSIICRDADDEATGEATSARVNRSNEALLIRCWARPPGVTNLERLAGSGILAGASPVSSRITTMNSSLQLRLSSLNDGIDTVETEC